VAKRAAAPAIAGEEQDGMVRRQRGAAHHVCLDALNSHGAERCPGVAGDAEYRGSVREVVSGADRNFRDWSELAAFMMAQLDEDEYTRAGLMEGGT
jgi:hypothetical protein